MKHKVKVHRWVKGVLQTRNYIFKTEKEAKDFVKENNFYMAKRYNEDGRLLETVNHVEHRRHHHRHDETYA